MKLSTVIVGFRTLISLLLLFAISGALSAQEAPAPDCVAEYDPAVNYFPETMQVEYAEGFTIDYANHYKIVTVTRPWPGAETGFTYVLVQCGTPAPDDIPDDAVVIEVPVTSAASLSATYAPHFAELDLLDTLIAVDNADNLYNPAIRERIEAGQIAEIGGGSTVNVELALDLAPQVIFTYGSGFPEYDAHPVLAEAGLTPVINGDFNETTPLGRAEWIKFTAAFFNREAEANAVFDPIVERYTELAALTADVTERPTVLVNAMFMGTWYVSGGASYAARLIADAGGDYVFADDPNTGGVPLSFEAVLEAAQDADIWINTNMWRSLADGLAEDERYAEFAAFANGQVYNYYKRSNAVGANDYFESGGLYVDVLLADLIAIFHPDLLPDHVLYYYERLS
jgi:iron complex transport system substrate-binding protein